VLRRLYLVRHGEVHNPGHLCYGDLPGYGLSAAGREQAHRAAVHLAASGADLLVSSPLARALETAAIVGRLLELAPSTDVRLTEFGLGRRWAGVVWEDLPRAFPGELEAYLQHPDDLPFSPESASQAAARVAAVAEELGRLQPGAVAVLVSHQDPIQAARLYLTGGSLAGLNQGKPGHGAVLTLLPGTPWRLESVWEPDAAGSRFPPV
jgi:broad specificity phosphatase PhoE